MTEQSMEAQYAAQFMNAMNLANKSMDLSVYLGEKIKILEDHITLCAKVINHLEYELGELGEDYLKGTTYWESTGVLRNLRIDNSKYEEIRARLDMLNALEAAGVDNWTGYGDAMEMIDE